MTKAVRKMARLTITAFGGAVCVPIAARKSDSTTTMRVNEVTMMRIDGASARTVTSATSCSARSVTPPPGPRSRLRVWEIAEPSRRIAPRTMAARASDHAGRALRSGRRMRIEG